MAVKIDDITKKKLVLVKQLYAPAVSLSASPNSTIRRILAVIGFDLAVETVLNTAVRALDSKKQPADTFQRLIQQADNLLKEPVVDRANILHVHDIRNDAQHKVKYPNETETNDCRTYTRDFLGKFIEQIWHTDLETISMLDIIRDEKVKEFIKEAETDLYNKDYPKAVRQTAAGLTWAMDRVKGSTVGRFPSFARGIMIMESSGEIAPKHKSEDLYRALEKMRETLLFLALGMKYDDFMRYKEIAGNVIVSDGGVAYHYNEKENLQVEEAEFVVTYCIDTIIEIENRVGNIDKPYGVDFWH